MTTNQIRLFLPQVKTMVGQLAARPDVPPYVADAAAAFVKALERWTEDNS